MNEIRLTPARIAALRRLEPGKVYSFDEVRGQVRVPMFGMGLLESVPGEGYFMRLTALSEAEKAKL